MAEFLRDRGGRSRSSPDAVIEQDVYEIWEGDGVQLSSTGTNTYGNTVSYAWDIDGDGVFDDSEAEHPSLTWEQLRGFGLDDNGSYRIALTSCRYSRPKPVYRCLRHGHHPER